MRILFLSDVNSAHTRKWALSLADRGFIVGIFSLSKKSSDWFKGNANIQYLSEETRFNATIGNDVSKLKYIGALPKLKNAIKSFKPDILHSHYATSYGLLGALSGFHPFIISVWGSDVFEFPRKSFIQRHLLKWNLFKADCILSTSYAMAKETAEFTTKKIEVTPFGIDLDLFKPEKVKSLFSDGDIVIGTIKALEPKYGIKYLIDAFDMLCKRHPALPLKLLLVGKGSDESSLKDLCRSKGIEDKVKFTGWVPPGDIPLYDNMLDVYAALSVSDSESFGVAVIEASACGKPVVVSDVSGFKEVVENGVTGLIVPRKDSAAAADAIEKLVLDNSLWASLGEAGRKRVGKNYDWDLNLKDIINIYNEIGTKR